jgi:hypothetical protein
MNINKSLKFNPLFIYGAGVDGSDVVVLETAKKLKEFGFSEPTYYYWLDGDVPFVWSGLKRVKLGDEPMNHNSYDEIIYSAPTKEQTLKFINEKWKSLMRK